MKKIFILFVLLILFIGVGFLITKNPWQTSNTVSGTIDLNGIAPSGSTIMLSQRIANSNAPFLVFAQNINAEDQTSWTFSAAEKGKSYEIQATLLVKNTVVTESSPLFVTAPANKESLVLNISSEELVAAAVATPTPGGTAIISGNVGVNGYIPPSATISVQGRSLGKTAYTVVAANLPAVDNQVMTYATAVAGRTYEVRGFLYDKNGQQIGESNVITITAPAKNEVLNINSNAQEPITATPTPQAGTATLPPSTSSAISGTINFNGQVPGNSRIVIFQRVSGTTQYQVALNNISPADGTTWSWTNGKEATSYDILAILKQKQGNGTDKDISNSNMISVTAPASNEVLSINSGFTLPQATGAITVSCNTYDSTNQTWQTAVSYQTIKNAKEYWFQIGTTNGGIELSNDTAVATNNPTQSYLYTFQNNVTYYARYAYANVGNIHANDPQFSPLSGTQQLRCSH